MGAASVSTPSDSTNGGCSTQATPTKKRAPAAAKASGSAKRRKVQTKAETESDSEAELSFDAKGPEVKAEAVQEEKSEVEEVKSEVEEKNSKVKMDHSKATEDAVDVIAGGEKAVKEETDHQFDDFMDAKEYLLADDENTAGNLYGDDDEFVV